MLDLTRYFATRLRGRPTPQREPIPASTQVPNSAGGYAWALDRWGRLDRFLVLGSEGGTYYVAERALTVENATAAAECIAEDGARAVARVVEISEAGRAPSNDPALFVLAMAAGLGNDATRRAALEALPRVARTGTHLFHWLQFVGGFRGWGRGVRRAVGAWYTERTAEELAYQLLKYAGRDGWTHRDVVRLAHPRPSTPEQEVLLRRAATGSTPPGLEDADSLGRVRAVDALAADPEMPADRAAGIVREARLTREMVPTGQLRHPQVWEALLETMPLAAMIRNLATMTRAGVLTAGSAAAERVSARLRDEGALRAARVHPVMVLSALRTYASGRGVRGSGSWVPVTQVTDALDAAFYRSFGAVEPSGRRVMLALDVSGSMTAPAHGLAGVSCREAAAAMALVTAAVEPRHRFTAFTAGERRSGLGLGNGLSELSISPRQRLDDVVRQVSSLPFGGTDCALPMVEALRRGWAVDLFVVYTDNETWAGDIHPAEALRRYRDRTGIDARLVVVAMASNGFTIADPGDAGMLDVVGFDAATPAVISDFAR